MTEAGLTGFMPSLPLIFVVTAGGRAKKDYTFVPLPGGERRLHSFELLVPTKLGKVPLGEGIQGPL